MGERSPAATFDGEGLSGGFVVEPMAAVVDVFGPRRGPVPE